MTLEPINSTRGTTETGRVAGPHRPAMGILARTTLVTWLVAMATLGVFIAVVVPSQRAAFLANLESKAHAVTVSLQDVAAGAAVSEDYSTVVDHCMRILEEDNSIDYLVLTRKDGFSLIHDRSGWRSDTLREFWNPDARHASGFIRKAAPADSQVFHYSRPFDYSGIEWGWIHSGLSLRAYSESVHRLYARTVLAVVACFFVGLIASIGYARKLTQPIMALRGAVHRLAAGDLSVRAVVTTRDEVGELGESFNQMTESLLQRDRILQSIRFAGQQFLSADDWRNVIDDVLSSLGQSFDVSHVSVYQCSGKGKAGRIQLCHEWVADHAPASLEALVERSYPSGPLYLRRWAECLETGAHVSGPQGCPETEQQILRSLGLQAILVVPIRAGGEWWGVIIVDDTRRERVWPEAVITSLRAAADTLGAAEERRQAREALVLAKEAAEDASAAKSQFLANMSHEIRTPITGVMGMLHLLRRTELDGRQEHYVASATNAADALLNVIGNILDFSKIEAGRMDLEASDFSVSDMLDSSVRIFAAKSEAKGIELIYQIAPDVPRFVHGDQNRLRQVVVNLVGNAIKFTDHGEILVSCRMVERSERDLVLRFAVRDTGCGIPPEKQTSIFDAFAQADNSMSRLHGGTGLGLAISRQICALMGGSIGVESTPGQGSTFWFTARMARASAEAGVVASPRSLEGLRVLAIDDCPTTLGILNDFILAWRGIPDVAQDAGTGLGMLRAAAGRGNPYHAAIVDWKMPGEDGVSLARRIKDDPAIAGVGLVLLSSFTQACEAPDVPSLFAVQIRKPTSMSELYDALVTATRGTSSIQRRNPVAAGEETKAEDVGRGRGRVLLVEDNEINREVASEIIAELGYECIHAVNGREAVQRVQTEGPDLVLMDCQMPIMDGYEATRIIRRWEAESSPASGGASPRSHIPIIALTAHAMKGDREVCINAGMDDFLTKPLDPDDLARMLARWTVGARLAAMETCPITTRDAADVFVPDEPGPAEAALQGPPPVDFEELVNRCMGKADVAHRLLCKFVDLAATYVDDVLAAIDQRDPATVERVAHRLKGSSANVSANGISELAAKIELAAKAGDLTAAPDLASNLMQELVRLQAAHGPERRAAA